MFFRLISFCKENALVSNAAKLGVHTVLLFSFGFVQLTRMLSVDMSIGFFLSFEACLANPTHELLARYTVHLVAALVLLDGRLAVRTRFRELFFVLVEQVVVFRRFFA